MSEMLFQASIWANNTGESHFVQVGVIWDGCELFYSTDRAYVFNLKRSQSFNEIRVINVSVNLCFITQCPMVGKSIVQSGDLSIFLSVSFF